MACRRVVLFFLKRLRNRRLQIFPAQVRADDEQRLECVDLSDARAECGKHGVCGLVTEIALPQAVIDVVRAESAGDARREIELLGGARGARQDAELAPAVRCIERPAD